MRKIVTAAGLAALAIALSACASSGSSTSSTGATSAPASTPAGAAASSGSSSGTAVDSTTISGTAVLTNSKGFTLYWYAPDTSTTSKCTGSCATYWPPVTGPVTAGSGVTGTLGTITRADGTVQATYDGHPLYTYAGDSAPARPRATGSTSRAACGTR